jgi:hypothetical protein
MKHAATMFVLVGTTLAVTPCWAAGDFFNLPHADVAGRVLRAVGCTMPEDEGGLIKCAALAGDGIPGTTDINIWDAQPASKSPSGKPSKATPPYVFMAWHDSNGGFLAPHTERREAEDMLRQVLLTVGVLDDRPVIKAFFGKVGPDEDKVTPLTIDGLKVFVEVENGSVQTDRRLFVGPIGFKLPD